MIDRLKTATLLVLCVLAFLFVLHLDGVLSCNLTILNLGPRSYPLAFLGQGL